MEDHDNAKPSLKQAKTKFNGEITTSKQGGGCFTIALVVLFICFLCWGISSCFKGTEDNKQNSELNSVTMPNVVGEHADTAQAELNSIGLKMITYKTEDGAFAGASNSCIVIDQSVKEGTEVDKKTQVQLTVRNLANKIKELLEEAVGNPITELTPKLQEYTNAFTVEISGTNQDITDSYSNASTTWIVVDSKNGKSWDSPIIYVKSQELYNSQKEAQQRIDALNAVLDKETAVTAVERYGKAQYPYGFKLHTFMGRLAVEPENDSSWFIKMTCDVTNAYGATAKELICEAVVTGTTENPRVASFKVY